MFLSETTLELIDKGSNYLPSFNNGLSNHLPMTLIALDKMGAGDSILNEFFDEYVKKLTTYEPIIDDSGKTVILNNPDYFSNNVHYYHQQIKQNGVELTLINELPLLLPGISAGAFHALIRLAYAIDIKHENEAAHALAYWAESYQELGALPDISNNTPIEIIEKVSYVNSIYSPSGELISDRMKTISTSEEFQTCFSTPKELNLRDIATIAISVYDRTKNFTLLHGVTGTHAMRFVLPYCSDSRMALEYFWQAFVVAYLTTKGAILDLEAQKPLSTEWDKILQKTSELKDEHDIKIVYTCWQEDLVYKQPSYKISAFDILKKNSIL